MRSNTPLAASLLLAMLGFAAARTPVLAADKVADKAADPAAAVVTAAPRAAFDLGADVNRVLKTFDVPGIAIAIVKDGQVVATQGFGVRKLGDPAPVTGRTLFEVASNSKAFTAAALAQLVDQGKLNWDDPVTKHLPDFQMYDAYVTHEMTVRDLLTHRSGLGLGRATCCGGPRRRLRPTKSSRSCATSGPPPVSGTATPTTICCISRRAKSSPANPAKVGARRCASVS